MTWTSVKTNRYIREDMTFLPQWVKVWHLYSKFLKRLQIYFLNQISNYCMHSKLKLTTLHLINKDFLKWINSFSDFSSVVQSCPTLYEPMYCSMPGLPVHHQLPEFTQTHVHWLVMPSNHLILYRPFPLPYSKLSQHKGLFKWVSSLQQVAKVLKFQLQHQSVLWTLGTDHLQDGLVESPCSPRDSQGSSPTPQFRSINSLALSFIYSPTLTSIHDHWKNHSLD